jgi:ketosteroid isomerase-like protein
MPMTTMRRLAPPLTAALFAFSLMVQAADSPLTQLVDAELAFSKMAGERGIRDSFLHYLAEDSVILAPVPMNGKQATRDGPADPGVLSWYPDFAGVSGAGDLGYSSGPYQYRTAADQAPVGFGYFISIWRRQADGEWKVVFDAGVRNVRSAQPPAAFERREESRKLVTPLPAAVLREREQSLRQTEMKLAAQTAARLARLAGEARFFRDRQQPLTEREAIAGLLREEKIAPAWKVEKVALAASGDLGYAYGTASVPGGIPERRSWMRVWSFEGGAWKIKLDLELPVAEPAKQG